MTKSIKFLVSSGLALTVFAGSYFFSESFSLNNISKSFNEEVQIAAPKGDFTTNDYNHVNRPPGY